MQHSPEFKEREALGDVLKGFFHKGSEAKKRRALLQLLTFTRSDFASVKRESATSIGPFFDGLPDMQEQVVDAVYDLCEDTDPEVRITGYKVIVELSRRTKSWTGRNTDVLIQLLQSEEPAELLVIKNSLTSHITNDAPGALTVLCDYCGGPSEAAGEVTPIPYLKDLVLAFLVEVKDTVVQESSQQNGVTEVFIVGMIKALTHATLDDANIIIHKLVIPLLKKSLSEAHYRRVLAALVDKANAALESETSGSTSGKSTLPLTSTYISLANDLLTSDESATCDPMPLLEFGCTLLTKLPTTDGYIIAGQVLDLFTNYAARPMVEASELDACRDVFAQQFSDITDILMTAIDANKLSWAIMQSLIDITKPKLEADKSIFTGTLTKINAKAERQLTDESAQGVSRTIKNIIPLPKFPPRRINLPPRPTTSPAPGKRKLENGSGQEPPVSLPANPRSNPPSLASRLSRDTRVVNAASDASQRSQNRSDRPRDQYPDGVRTLLDRILYPMDEDTNTNTGQNITPPANKRPRIYIDGPPAQLTLLDRLARGYVPQDSAADVNLNANPGRGGPRHSRGNGPSHPLPPSPQSNDSPTSQSTKQPTASTSQIRRRSPPSAPASTSKREFNIRGAASFLKGALDAAVESTTSEKLQPIRVGRPGDDKPPRDSTRRASGPAEGASLASRLQAGESSKVPTRSLAERFSAPGKDDRARAASGNAYKGHGRDQSNGRNRRSE